MVLAVSDPQYQTFNLNFLGSYSLVGIGKFNLVFLWLIGVVRSCSGFLIAFWHLHSGGGHVGHFDP